MIASHPTSAAPRRAGRIGVVGIALALAFLAIMAAGSIVRQSLLGGGERDRLVANVELVVGTALVLWASAVAYYFYRIARREQRVAEEKERLVGQLREAERKYRSIFDNASEGIFQTTPEGRIITANHALARMYGYRSPEHLMESLTDIAAQLYVDPAQRQAVLAKLRGEEAISNFELEVLRADGRTLWVRENIRAVRDAAGKLSYLEGTVEDVSSLWWGEQRRRLQYATAQVLGEAVSVEAARPLMLRTICEGLDWAMGAVWDVDLSTETLECVEVWHAAGLEIAEFEEAYAQGRLRLGEGLAGEVWKSSEPIWRENLASAPNDVNAALAVRCGMGSAVGIPIQVQGQVRHVFEFVGSKVSLPDPELLQTLGAIGSQLGQLIEHKRAEEALRRSETRKAAILSSALDCIISFDAEGRIIEFNPAAERTFGYAEADALGRPIAELLRRGPVGDGDDGMLRDFSASELRGALGTRVKLQAVRCDGGHFPVEVAVSCGDVAGKPLCTAYVRDITERERAQRSTSELAAVVANSNDAIIACSLEGTIHSWNLGAERTYGYSAEEAIGQPLGMLLPEERQDEVALTLAAVRKGESQANYETVRVRKAGKKISVSLTESPIRGEGGEITGISSIARDITERKRLEEELLQSQKMDAVGRLAGGIAHDFNNVLTAILGYSDLIIGQTDERQWMFKHLLEIRKAADFAASLTHQLLAFSRRQPLILRVFHINDVVATMHKMLQRVIGEHVHIQTKLDAKVGRLKADASQLEQVLLNLCVNARDAMPDGGSITIQTLDVTYLLDEMDPVADMPAGEYVSLRVTDTGHGMPEEVKKHIFEPFFTTKEKGQGTGLGLATCYGIVRQSGGYIAVESEVGVGTTFSVFLPRVEETGEKSAVRKEVGQLPGGNETILYVEDEITVRSLTAHVLRRLGYTVLEASDGKQARSLLEEESGREIQLLFSDVVLPDAGGRELADHVLARHGAAKVLFTSGYVDETILKRHGLDPGAAFLQKPFSPAELAKKVREVIDGQENSAS